MTDALSGYDGQTNGVTPVTVVPAPGVSTRRIVKGVTFSNPMAATSVVLTYYLDNNGTARQIWKGTVQGGETFGDDVARVLDTTTKTLKAVLDGAYGQELQFVATFDDIT